MCVCVCVSVCLYVCLSVCLLLTISVHLVDHVLQLRLCRVLPQGPHDGAQLLGGDGAVAIFVEEAERFFEL